MPSLGTATATALSVALVVAGCSAGTAGGPVEVTPAAKVDLYAPRSVNALAFSVPETIGGISLRTPVDTATRADVHEFSIDPLVWQLLVDNGLGDGDVHLAQRADRLDTTESELPDLAVSALWVDGLAADSFAELDPFFYFVLTTATPGNYRWDGDKPAREVRTVSGREVFYAEFASVDVAWYTRGEVMYIVMAANPQLMASALLKMPRSDKETTVS